METKKMLTLTPEKANEIKSNGYFPFEIIWMTPKYYPVETPAFYVKTSKGINTPEYFAELLAERAINNDDYEYQSLVAKKLDIINLFEMVYNNSKQ